MLDRVVAIDAQPRNRSSSLTVRAEAEIRRRKQELVTLSRRIHGCAEVAWQEHESAALVAGALESAGFRVERGAYGLPTAVEAVSGDGDFTVVLCAEYDALPGLGHACGHNVIAAAAVGAAVGLSAVAAEAGLRVKVLGTPAEEGGGGKITLLAAGAWEDADISLMVHGMSAAPGTAQTGYTARALHSSAIAQFRATFTGRAAHAGTAWMGVNAGNAALLSMTAVAMLRQHLPAGTLVNAFIKDGGHVVNAIPDLTVLDVEVRAPDIQAWRDAKSQVQRCFEGAAHATGCSLDWEVVSPPYAPMQPDDRLADLWDAQLTARGVELSDAVLHGPATDMGNVSLVVPAIHPLIALAGVEASPHQPDFAAAAATEAADDAVLQGAVALAATVIEAACDQEHRAKFLRRSAERPAGHTRKPFEL